MQDVTSWLDFEEIVEQLIEHKNEVPYKLIGLDTLDVLWDLVQDRVVQEWNIANPNKRTRDISGVGAKGDSDQGYGVGYAFARKKVRTAIDKLKRAGYGVMAITHSKDKEIKERDGFKYDQLVCSIPNSAREVFVNMADFIVFLTLEKEQGDIKGSVDTKRYMYFRGDGYVEAGSRFKNVPIRIEYDVDDFISTIKNAIATEFDEGEDLNAVREKQLAEREAQVEKFLQEGADEYTDATAEDLIEKIDLVIAEMNVDKEKRKILANIFREETGAANYKNCTDVDRLKSCIVRLKKL